MEEYSKQHGGAFPNESPENLITNTTRNKNNSNEEKIKKNEKEIKNIITYLSYLDAKEHKYSDWHASKSQMWWKDKIFAEHATADFSPPKRRFWGGKSIKAKKDKRGKKTRKH